MRFSLVSVYVKDMEKSLFLYHSLLEMPIVRRIPGHGGGELVFLGEEDKVSLELIEGDAPAAYMGFSLGFEVEDLAAAKKRLLDAGYPILEEMAVGPQTTICFFGGPNGEKIELIGH